MVTTNRQKEVQYWLIIGALFVATGTFSLIVRLRRPAGTFPVEPSQMSVRLAEWAQHDAVPFSSDAEWIDVLQNCRTDDCLTLPPGAKRVVVDEIPGAARSLDEAVTELIGAYADNSPEALWQFMADHGEELGADRIEVIKDLLSTMRRVSRGTLAALSAYDTFIAYWREAKINPHWSRIVKASGCRQLWRCDRIPDEKMREVLSEIDSNVFQNVYKVVHNFSPQVSLESVLQSGNTLLFADVKMVVRLDHENYNATWPCFFRFWYEPDSDTWHPYQLELVRTVEGVDGPQMVF